MPFPRRARPNTKGARPPPKGRALPHRGAPSPKGALLPNSQSPDPKKETDRGLTLSTVEPGPCLSSSELLY
ncbi:MAG: hypothetical protein ACK56F_30245 [bacterium]